MNIYTDGSCYPNPGKGAWAYVVHLNDGGKLSDSGFDGFTTNNRMEMMALIKAIQWSIKNNHSPTIYCDSEYTVKGFNIWCTGWAKNNFNKKGGLKNSDLWKDLYKLKKKFKGQVVWVRGHNGDEGNEEVDMLANLTRQQNN